MLHGKFRCRVSQRERLNLSEGDLVTLYGSIEYECENVFHFDETTCVVPVSEWARGAPLNSFHLFAGSFNGWSQAIEAVLEDESFPPLGQQVCVDSDPVTMSLWSHQVGKPHHLGRTLPGHPWNPSGHIGVCTPVGDTSLIHQVNFPSNSVGTASPPCVSWSRAGKSKGLNSDPGFAFVEALVIVFVLRPNLQLFECADEILQHQHFGLISHLLKLGGYKRVWQQNLKFHRMSDNHRDRWLSVWIRADHSHDTNTSVYQLCDEPRVPWHSTQYNFRLPQASRDALRLSDDMKTIYGDCNLLPPAKKARISPDHTPEQVLRQRMIPLNEPLPTVCAMYGKQHELDPSHVAHKGLFASLVTQDDSVAFIEPTRIAALLGGINRISLPSNPLEAFHGLGNAVSVPQASLALLVGLQAISKTNVEIERIVGRIWSKRLTSTNSITTQEGDFLTIVDVRLLFERVFFQPAPICLYPMKFALKPEHGTHCTHGSCSEAWSVDQLLGSFARIEPLALSQVSLRHGLVVASAADTISDLLLISGSWGRLCGNNSCSHTDLRRPIRS